ncbi:hypothetical protein ACFORO_12425 [Amycolatopsis halotolerans]|uniref:Helix-turn-helix domain-containing protein n=1 Tax=Amycolatopsis halotolerans TaxID=330083 RepID=A0ABV7QF49_9PSEU
MSDVRACLLGCRTPDGYARRAAPGSNVCPPCSEALRGVLAKLALTYRAVTELDELIPGGRPGDGVRRVPGPRSPAVDGILAHTDPRSRDENSALAVVESWARWVRAERSIDVDPGQMLATVPAGRVTMERELATLRFNWDWIMGSPEVPWFAQDMRGVALALRQVRGELDRVTRVGKCPTVVVAGQVLGIPIDLACGASLRVRPGATKIVCRNCGGEWERDRWHELGDARADYATFAEQFNVPVGTLRRWANEDHWDKTGTRGRALWLRAEVFASYVRRRGDLTFDQAG